MRHRASRYKSRADEEKNQQEVAPDACPFGAPRKQPEHDRDPGQRECAQQQDPDDSEPREDPCIRSEAEHKREEQDERSRNRVEDERCQNVSGQDR